MYDNHELCIVTPEGVEPPPPIYIRGRTEVRPDLLAVFRAAAIRERSTDPQAYRDGLRSSLSKSVCEIFDEVPQKRGTHLRYKVHLPVVVNPGDLVGLTVSNVTVGEGVVGIAGTRPSKWNLPRPYFTVGKREGGSISWGIDLTPEVERQYLRSMWGRITGVAVDTGLMEDRGNITFHLHVPSLFGSDAVTREYRLAWQDKPPLFTRAGWLEIPEDMIR